MDRRTFIASAAATVLLPAFGASASETLTYVPGLVEDRLAAGDTVLADFYAPWCSTCRAQERVTDQLRADNPAYDAAITFIRVDWDTYGTGDLATRLQIPRRSTLVLLRGDAELGRIVAGTRGADIEALLNLALA
ncbi:thioredoxin [Rhodobacterales bacterium HKCCE2091]|nr:thioredoxin [Rhodobacterales bacterium HKCCE2091]